MSWIGVVTPEHATGALADVYQRIRAGSPIGRVVAVWQTTGADPKGTDAIFACVRALMDDPAPLTKAQAEMIAVVASATNGCGYVVAHHGPRLAKALGDEALARAVARDYREANLTARDRVLLDAAVALTCEPSERKREDVERLREYGFDDLAILKATEITGIYNLVNRLISGLGVELESDIPAWEFGSQK
jgi:uncharacterized peroxidase-related enzyme